MTDTLAWQAGVGMGVISSLLFRLSLLTPASPLCTAGQRGDWSVLLPGCQCPALFGSIDGSDALSLLLSLKSLLRASEKTMLAYLEQKAVHTDLAGAVNGNNR